MTTIGFDTETKGLDWWDEDQQAFLGTWADDAGEYDAELLNGEADEFLDALSTADRIVAHNLKFDIHQTRETTGLDVLELGAELHDTDLLSRVLYPEGQRKGERGGHSLKNLAKVYLRADADASEDAIKEMAKAIGLRTIKQKGAYYEVWRAYPDVMEEYARNDARFTLDLYEAFAPKLGDLASVYEMEMQVLPILVRAEQRGVRTDQVECARLKAKFTAERDKVYEYLSTELGETALGGEGSEDGLIEALLSIGVPLHRKTDTGKLSTAKFALQEFSRDFPQIEALFEYRRLERFLTNYIGAIEGREIVHASFSQCGAWTSRMSCVRPNMQNWPKRAGKEVRAVLIPREGHSFVICDYDSIEIRLLAYYLGDEGFRTMIDEGHDPHAWMATNIWGGTVDEFRKDGPKDELRGLAKNILFAITYGAGAPRVSDMLRDAGQVASKEMAKTIISKIKQSLPNYYKLMKRIRNKIETEGCVNTILGRKQVVSRDKSYVGMNALIQGSAAEIMKLGLIAVDEAVKPLDGIPLLIVHDEVVVECLTENAEQVLGLTKQALEGAWSLSPRLAVTGSVVHTSYADA